MILNKRATELTYKILANLQVTDYVKHEADLKAILMKSLSAFYIKGRVHERTNIDYYVMSNGIAYIPES